MTRVLGNPSRTLLLLLLAVTALYARTATFEFLNLDDLQHILLNPMVAGGLSLEGVRWALGSTEFDLWMPISWLSWMVDASLFGLDPAAYHLENVAWQLANCLLLERCLRGLPLSAWQRLGAVTILALHPQHVEVVAWVIERKELLAMLFGLLSWLAFQRWATTGSVAAYLWSVMAFAFSLAAKPMWVGWPLILLFLDASQGRLLKMGWRSIVVDKLPFVLLSLFFVLFTLRSAAANGSISSLASLGLLDRLQHSLAAYAFYLEKSFLPIGLSTHVPLDAAAASGTPYGHWFGLGWLLALSWLAWQGRRRMPIAALGWLWFVVALFPVSGVSPIGAHWVADRYSYFPHVGLSLAVVACAGVIAGWSAQWRRGVGAVAVAGALTMLALSAGQLPHWRNSETFWQRSLATSGETAYARYQYGNYFLDTDQPRRALAEYRRASELKPLVGVYLVKQAKAATGIGDRELLTALLQQLQRLGLEPGALTEAVNLASRLVTLGYYREARQLLVWLLNSEARQQPTARPRLLLNLGIVGVAEGDVDAGLSLISQAFESDAATADRACRAWRQSVTEDPLVEALLPACRGR